MSKKEPFTAFKLCIFGEGGVGKSTLTQRYLTGIFNESTKMTIGADFYVKDVEVEGKRIRLRIWDFGGEEQFRVLMPSFAKNAQGGIFMYDITRYASLKKIDEWLGFFVDPTENQLKIPVIMVGGKHDLQEKRSITEENAMEMAKSHNLVGYSECSSKTGANVQEIFEMIARQMLESEGYL